MRFLASLSLGLSLAAFAACGSNSGSTTDGGGGGGGGDGGGGGGGDGSTGPLTLTLSGIASDIGLSGSSPLPGVTLTAYSQTDDSMLGTATSAADGSFAITVTSATAVNGYLKATYGTSYKTTYLYPPYPLSADYANVPVFVLSKSTYDIVNSGVVLGNNQQTTNGWVGLLIEDAAGAKIAGATATSTPMGTVNYNGSNGQPSKAATATFTDGIAYDTNITAGDVTVSAAMTGATFQSHTIKVRPDAVTLTLVTE